MWPLAIGMGVGAAASAFGASEQASSVGAANETARQMMLVQEKWQEQQNAKAMAFSAQQVQEQERYETEMSNTAYQRQAKDMQAAGINPIVGFGGGASAPSVSAPSGVSSSGSAAPVSAIPSVISNTISGAKDLISTYAGFKQAMASADAASAQAKKTGVDTTLASNRIPGAQAESSIMQWFNKTFENVMKWSAKPLDINFGMDPMKWKHDAGGGYYEPSPE